jgi:hypothetical protein
MARELSGTLSRNEKREEGSNQPEYRGKALIGGVEFKISAWIKEYEGRKFFSLAFSPPKEEPKVQASPELKAQQSSYGNGRRDDHRRGVLDEEVPF